MITATITRPTSITPTSSCDTKIALVESVDVGPMLPPKPRTISLEPISRKTRKRRGTKGKEGDSPDTGDAGSGSEAARMAGSPLPDDSASQCGSIDHHATPRSPVPSDMQSTVSTPTSADSTVSSSTGLSFRLGPVPSSAKSTRNSHRSGSKVSLADQTITATIELLKSGCLPGDNIPLRISIKHTKAIKSMHGIIITLYRQGRIDSAPPLSLFADIKGKEAERLKHEEYYPKSKTGLGGLSLSSAGSSSMFRKDLAQTFAPILVDPTTLTAVINASVRVPEDVFPTIKGVPGEMISFKYHLEVVLDLGGKLAGQQRHVPRVGAVTAPSHNSGSRTDANTNMLAAWGGSIVDTENIRREKSVVACLFEVVVGTKDSARVRGRSNSARRQIADWSQEALTSTAHEPIYEESITTSNHDFDHEQQQPYPYYEHPYDERYPDYYDQDYEYQDVYPDHPPPLAHAHIPPPVISDEQDLTEKERVRRAEERLLPSQPPMDVAGPSASAPMVGPSHPPVEPEEDLYSADDTATQAAAELSGFHRLNHVSSARTIGPSAPALEDLHPAAALQPTEDKQELERRRLLAEASAPSFPPDVDDDEGTAGEGSSSVHHHQQHQLPPSAPPLMEDDYQAFDHLPGPSRRDTLPRYER
jgi:hypothetical protein